MKVEKIVEELEKRKGILTRKKNELESKRRDVRFQEPFCDKTDREIDENMELYRELDKREKPYNDRINAIYKELRPIEDMLYVYQHPYR